jgi:hypothetical protein
MNSRPVLVPYLDRYFTRFLLCLESLLVVYALWEDDGDVAPGELPAPLGDRIALDALYRIWEALPCRRGSAAVGERTGRLLAADGYEYPPLYPVILDPEDIAVMAETAAVLGDPRAPEAVRDGLKDSSVEMRAEELIPRTALLADQLAGLMEASRAPEAKLYCALLGEAGPAEDIVFTPEEEAAYRRLATCLREKLAGVPAPDALRRPAGRISRDQPAPVS